MIPTTATFSLSYRTTYNGKNKNTSSKLRRNPVSNAS
jgi:hypothetical protein